MSTPTLRLEISHQLEGTDEKVSAAVELDLAILWGGKMSADLSIGYNWQKLELAIAKILQALNWDHVETSLIETQNGGSKSCDCLSHSRPMPWQKTENVILRVCDYGPEEWRDTFRNTEICVDACIAPVVADMWRAGIWTESSCCGHGNPKHRSVVVEGVNRLKAMEFLAYRDPSVNVMAWENVRSSPRDYEVLKGHPMFQSGRWGFAVEAGENGEIIARGEN